MIDRIKIVPDAEPNADGIWLELPRPVDLTGKSWSEYEAVLADFIPEGYHLVQI